jgi:hypothetical protein
MTSHSMYRHSMSTTQNLEAARASLLPSATEQQHRIEHTAVAASLGWSGWGSPVGLGILLTSVGLFILCLHWAGIVH